MKTIALFVGTFNPFHRGHMNVVEKAEAIFGKGNVYIAFGINPDKVEPSKLSEYLKDVQDRVDELANKTGRPVKLYKGFLHDFITQLESEDSDVNVVVVKGLRNGDDLAYEVNQLRFIEDFKKGIKTTFIVCDKEYEHISSSAIRKIKEFGGDVEKYSV
jgi:pantetheine-phosphate adenylyltransferase